MTLACRYPQGAYRIGGDASSVQASGPSFFTHFASYGRQQLITAPSRHANGPAAGAEAAAATAAGAAARAATGVAGQAKHRQRSGRGSQ